MFHPPGLRHQSTLGNLLMSLYAPVREQQRGLLLGPCGVVLSDQTIVVPDLLFLSRERRDLLGEEYIEGPPDLVVEIMSPRSAGMDRATKRNLYARYGVQNYWLVEPGERWARAYELGADGFYELVAEGHGEESFAAPPFPDLVIPLGELWDDLSYA